MMVLMGTYEFLDKDVIDLINTLFKKYTDGESYPLIKISGDTADRRRSVSVLVDGITVTTIDVKLNKDIEKERGLDVCYSR